MIYIYNFNIYHFVRNIEIIETLSLLVNISLSYMKRDANIYRTLQENNKHLKELQFVILYLVISRYLSKHF